MRITERTIYPPIINYLKHEIGADAIIEPRVGRGYVDIVFKLNSDVFIAEIKFGDEKEFIKAIDQVWQYASDFGTKNVLVLIIPKELKDKPLIRIEDFDSYILSQKARARVYSDYWSEWLHDWEIKRIFKEIQKRFKEKRRKIDFNSIVSAIRESVQDLYYILKQTRSKDIIDEVAVKLELFIGLGDVDKDRVELESQISMLAAYLLFNQLLFYHVYKTKTGDDRLPELRPVKSIKELNKLFQRILSIDYQPIYSINILNKIPNIKETIEIINRTIKHLVLLRAEHVTHDLAGRFFHALLPKEVAKTWAAFYTNPYAAKILADLAIDRWDEAVIDPACGSGTLLSASYLRKLELYLGKRIDYSEVDLKSIHKKFIENDITGIDIMPFAAHLAAINLAAQRIDQPTNTIRIARADSLELAPKISRPEFEKEGYEFKPFVADIQFTLDGEKIVIKKSEVVSPEGLGRKFILKPVDVVIMNPPFSDRNKLPAEYRKKLSDKTELGRILGKKCGHQVNLWGYFIALADILLKEHGKLAAVVPINIARGKATEKIRKLLLDSYYIRYIIKPVGDLAFSESAKYKDILIVCEKRRGQDEDLTKIVFVKSSVKNMNDERIKRIVTTIKTEGKESNILYVDNDLEIISIPYHELRKSESWMPLLYSQSLKNKEVLEEFYKQLINKGHSKLRKLTEKEIKPAFPFRPSGTTELVFITRPLDPSRIKKAFLLMSDEKDNYITVKIKGTNKTFNIPKAKIIPALRTATGISKIEITNDIMDFVVIKPYREFKFVLNLSKWKKDRNFDWIKHIHQNISTKTYLCIPDKINLSSPNTKLMAFYSENEFVPGPTFFSLITKSKEEAKLLSLCINSVMGITQFLRYKSETLGTYIRLLTEDWKQIYVLDYDKLNKEDRKMLEDAFLEIKDIEFPSIISQMKNRFKGRRIMDQVILKILGFDEKEIDKILDKVYEVIVDELESMASVK